MTRLLLLFVIAVCFYSCTTVDTGTSSVATPINPAWTGFVVNRGYVHSLSKQLIVHKGNKRDSLFLDTNPNNTIFEELSSTIKIGKSRDSITSGDVITYSPQNGFIVFDLIKNFGGTVTNIRTANLKVKLFQKTGYTDDLKFVVSLLDTTILAQSAKDRIITVQNSSGQSIGYLTEFTLDVKGSFSSSGKIIVGIKAENADQVYASVQYCKIEFDGDIRTTTSSQTSR